MRWFTLILAAACSAWVPCTAGGQPSAAAQEAVTKAPDKRDSGKSDAGKTVAEKPVTEQDAAATFKEIGATVELDAQGHVLSIEAEGDGLTDGVAGKLSACKSLESLELGKSKISGAALRAIRKLTSLQRLYVHDVSLTDDALANLQGLSRLKVLSLQNTKIRGAGLAVLKDHEKLRVVNLSGTEVGDDALAYLVGLEELDTLALEDTKVTGAGLKTLKPLERLRVLNLSGCKISGRDLNDLLSHAALRMLYVHRCGLEEKDIEDFGGKMESLAIYR